MKLILLALLLWLAWRYLRRPVAAKWRPVRDEAEARALLGVAIDADADAIRAAHRRLAASVHPDRGGSAELAKRVNAARDLLLRRA